jgi:hypothetical protein
MTIRIPLATLAVALGAAAGAIAWPVMADDTGLAVLHDLRREGGRNCFLDHFHYGNSSGASSRKVAESEAISSWSGFVDLEYGSDWARFSRAASKSVKCEQTGGGWGCAIEARPCK